MRLNIGKFIEKHRLLELDLQRDRKSFLSDWNGRHPFLRDFIGNGFHNLQSTALSGKYLYLDDQANLTEAICSFHARHNEVSVNRSNIIAGSGSSSLLAAFCLWLLQERDQSIYYIPPLYHTFHHFLHLVGMRPRPLTSSHLFALNAKLNLPKKKSILLLTDPVWYAGWCTSEEIIDQLVIKGARKV